MNKVCTPQIRLTRPVPPFHRRVQRVEEVEHEEPDEEAYTSVGAEENITSFRNTDLCEARS